MTIVYLSPDPINSTQFIPGSNTPAAGAKLFSYIAGSTTKQDAFVDNTGVGKWSNPIILDSGGNLGGSNEVWIPAGLPAKFVLAPSNDTDPPVSPYWTRDNLTGINDTTATQTEWVAGPIPTFISTTSFSLVGDQTLIFTVNRRVRTTNTGGTVYSTIVTSVFGVLTTVTVINDSGTLDAGLSAVWYGLIPPTNNSLPRGIYNVSKLIVGTAAALEIAEGFSTTSDARFLFRPDQNSTVAGLEVSANSPALISMAAGTFNSSGAFLGAKGIFLDTGTSGTVVTPTLSLNVQTTTVGASTATLTNSPHSGNPTIWPRITVNGTTFCFPAFLTS